MNPPNLARIEFWTLFNPGLNGSLVVKSPFTVNGITFNQGFVIPPGQLLAGVDFHQRKGIPVAIYAGTNPPVIYGFYSNP